MIPSSVLSTIVDILALWAVQEGIEGFKELTNQDDGRDAEVNVFLSSYSYAEGPLMSCYCHISFIYGYCWGASVPSPHVFPTWLALPWSLSDLGPCESVIFLDARRKYRHTN